MSQKIIQSIVLAFIIVGVLAHTKGMGEEPPVRRHRTNDDGSKPHNHAAGNDIPPLPQDAWSKELLGEEFETLGNCVKHFYTHLAAVDFKELGRASEGKINEK